MAQPYSLHLDPDVAQQLADQGGALLILDMPEGSYFGVDHMASVTCSFRQSGCIHLPEAWPEAWAAWCLYRTHAYPNMLFLKICLHMFSRNFWALCNLNPPTGISLRPSLPWREDAASRTTLYLL